MSNASLQYNLRDCSTKFHLQQPKTEYLKKSLSQSIAVFLILILAFLQPVVHDVCGLTYSIYILNICLFIFFIGFNIDFERLYCILLV